MPELTLVFSGFLFIKARNPVERYGSRFFHASAPYNFCMICTNLRLPLFFANT